MLSLTTALGSSSKKSRQGKRTPTELWTSTLRQSGVGFTPQTTTNMDSFTGLQKSQMQNMSYSSTSHFLRQKAGTEKVPTPRHQQNGMCEIMLVFYLLLITKHVHL